MRSGEIVLSSFCIFQIGLRRSVFATEGKDIVIETWSMHIRATGAKLDIHIRCVIYFRHEAVFMCQLVGSDREDSASWLGI